MKIYIRPICLLLMAVSLFASCLDDDETEITLYDDIAITDFEITSGTVSGTTGVTLAGYPFSIDQQKGEIYNVDSLPVGTVPSSLLCSYGTKNNGLVYLENLTGDEWTLLTTTDAVDFSTDRKLYVVASDNSANRMYTVSVRIHEEDGDEFRWTQLGNDGVVPELQALGGMKAVLAGDCIVVFGQDAGHNNTVMWRTSLSDGNTWTYGSTTFGPEAYNNVVVSDETLFVLDGTALKRSDDGGLTFTDVAWSYDNPEGGLARLVGGSANRGELYALTTDSRIAVSTDGGQTWTADDLGDDAGYAEKWLPAQDVTFCCTGFSYNDSTDYVLLAGNRAIDGEESAGDANAVAWRKIVEYSKGSRAGQWAYINVDDTNIYPLPRLSGLTVLGYGGSLIAFGGAGIGGCESTPFSSIYESRDGGITWKKSSSYTLPSEFDTAATSFAAVVDGDNYIWIICGGTGQVWRGRLNRLGWENN